MTASSSPPASKTGWGQFRAQFAIPDPHLIYLDGNSLGRLPLATTQRLNQAIQFEWGDRLIRSWNEGWFETPNRLGDKIARLIGAEPGEVILADSTSVNLFKLVVAAILARPGRRKIVTDNLNFPSDIYILQGAIRTLDKNHQLQIVASADGVYGPVDALATAIDENTALLALSHTVFKSSYTYDMKAMTEAAHARGSLILWDLSHAAGSVPVDLNGAAADLAVGCTYKYLNGGPGAPAFLYVRKDLQDQLINPLSGWIGQASPFEFGLDYQPAIGIQHFLTGTPPMLSLLAIEPGLDMLLAAGMNRLRTRSVQLSQTLLALWHEYLEPLGFRLRSPHEPDWRGSHLTLAHDEGWRINQALIKEMNVLGDFRQPNNIRLGIAPLYNNIKDIEAAVDGLQQIVNGRLYEKYDPAMTTVT